MRRGRAYPQDSGQGQLQAAKVNNPAIAVYQPGNEYYIH